MNITKLSTWPKLQAMGFYRVNFRSHGRIVSVGCSDGNITIEPAVNKYSDGKSYHITGNVRAPQVKKVFRYEQGRKVEYYEMENRINAGKVAAMYGYPIMIMKE